MPRTLISTQTPLGPYPGTVAAGALAVTFTAADATNNNRFALTGHELLLVWNTTGSAASFTLHSTPDSRGRTGDITAYSVAGNTMAAFAFSSTEGWIQSDGSCYIDAASGSGLQFAVVRLGS